MLEDIKENLNSKDSIKPFNQDKRIIQKYSLIVEMTFDAAHRLSNYVGKCKRIHGHTYKILVKISSENLLKWGAILDFGDLKKIMKDHIDKKYDHKLLDRKSVV